MKVLFARLPLQVAFALGLLCLANLAHAAVCQFNQPTGSWTVPANWANCGAGNGAPAGTPGPADRAEIAGGNTATLPAGNFTVSELFLQNGTVQGAGIGTTTLSTAGALFTTWGGTGNTLAGLTLSLGPGYGLDTSAGSLAINGAELITNSGTTTVGSVVINGTGSRIQMTGGTAYNAAGNHTMTAGGVFQNSSGVFKALNSITIDGTFVNAANIEIPAGITLSLANAAAMSQVDPVFSLIFGDGTLSAPGQTLTLATGGVRGGNLTFNVGTLNNTGAVVRPAPSFGATGVLTINGNFVQSGTGIVDFNLAGLAPSQYDRIVVSGNVTLGGGLSRGAVGTFAPPVGTLIDIITAGSVSGGFSSGSEAIVFDAPRRYLEIISATKVTLRANETVWVIGDIDDVSPTVPSLRNAIARFNAESGSGCINAPYAVHFFLPMGSTTIQPTSALPVINGCPGLLIDGYTQSGSTVNSSPTDWNATLSLTLDGSVCSGCPGIAIDAASTVVRGINFVNWGKGIGIGANGTSASVFGNYFFQGNYGVFHDTAGNVAIGSSALADRNVFVHAAQAGVFSANQSGGSPLVIRNNLIGAGAGLTPGGNTRGILISGTNGVLLSDNVIANNTKGLVVQVATGIDYSANNTFVGNGIPVDLNDDGPSANDDISPPYDTDMGANLLLNFPKILSVTPTSASTANISYELRSNPGANFQLCFCKNPSGGAQCEVPLTPCQAASTDASGLYTNTIGILGLSGGTALTMFTQAMSGPKSGNMSEISPGATFGTPGVTLSVSPIVIPPTPLNWTRALFVDAINSTASPVTFSPPSVMGSPEITVGVNQVPNCITGTIPAMGQCAFIFNVTPTAQIAYSGTFVLSTSAGLVTAPVSSSGIATIAFPTVVPGTVNFPATPLMSTSMPQTVTFASPAGGATVQFQALGGIFGTDAADFSFLSDGCSNQFVAAGASCTLQPQFAPQSTNGAKTASLLYLAVEPSNSFRTIGVTFTGTAGATASCAPNEVTSTGDSGPCTLRDTIAARNASCGAPSTITFNIAGAGPHTIQPLTDLPDITCPNTTIDGYTQPGSAPNSSALASGNSADLRIILDGSGASLCRGVSVLGNSVTVRGLAVRSFGCEGLFSSGPNTTFTGNYVGTDPGGFNAFGNGFFGIKVAGDNAVVGGTLLAEANFVTSNGFGGIQVAGPSTSFTIAGNQIGGNRAGGGTLVSGGDAIDAGSGSGTINNNVIHFHTGNGILVNTAGPTISGNTISANNSAGIHVNSSNSFIASNTVTGSGLSGVVINSGTGNRILTNSIFNNSGNTGIALIGGSQDDVSPPYDLDSGGNNGQNYPVIASVVQSAGSTTVSGVLKTDGLSQPYTITFYGNSVAGIRQGETFLASLVVTTDATGVANFNQVLAGNFTNVSATATRQIVPLDTSEFSPTVAATGVPVFSPSATSFTFPAQSVATASTAQTLTITNTGTAVMSILSPTISAPFAISANTCTGLAPLGTCTISFTFTPTAAGAATGTLSIPTNAPGSPHAILLSGTGAAAATGPYAYIPIFSSFSGSTVSVIDLPTNTLATTINVGLGPVAATVNTANTRVYVSNQQANSISVIDTASNTVIATIPVGSQPGTAALNPAGTRLYVPNQTSNTMSVIDTTTNTVIATITGLTFPAGAAVNPAGTRVYVNLSSSNSLGVIDTATNTLVANVPVAIGPYQPVVNGAGTRVYVVCTSGNVSVLDTSTNAVIATITVGSNSRGIALDPAGTRAYVVNSGSNNISILDLTTNSVLTTVTAGSNPWGVAGNAAGTRMYVANSGSNSVSVFDTATNTVVATVPVGIGPVGLGQFVAPAAVALAPAVTLAPTTLAFGTRTVNTTSPAQGVTLSNSGTAGLVISSITGSGDFGFTTNCPLLTPPLGAGASCAINVSFSPLTVAALTGTITIVSNAPGSPHVITLSGTSSAVAVAGIGLSPTSLDFGSQAVGATGNLQTVRVGNTGFATLSLLGISVSPPFSRQTIGPAQGDCGVSLAPALTCQIAIAFTPTAGGSASGVLSIISNASGSPHQVPLTGIGTTVAVPQISVPATFDFGDQVVNTGATGQLAIDNTGSGLLTITSITLTGTDAASFTAGSNCPTVAAGSSCRLNVTFTAANAGVKTAQLVIVSDSGGAARNTAASNTVSLRGNGILAPRPIAKLSVTGLGFGNVIFGGATPNQLITLSNIGGVAMSIAAIQATGDYMQMNSCTATLAPNASCSINVLFSPLGLGSRLGELQVYTNADGSPHRVQLGGTGCRWFSQSQSRFLLTACGN